MAYFPATNAVGYLTAPIGAVDNVVYVNEALRTYLLAAFTLDPSNHTYLLFGEAPNREVVKVIGVTPTGLEVERGIEDPARVHAINTPITYEITAAAVHDILTEVTGNALTVQGVYPINVDQVSPGTYEVSLDGIYIESSDGSIDVNGSGVQFDLTVNKDQIGCC